MNDAASLDLDAWWEFRRCSSDRLPGEGGWQPLKRLADWPQDLLAGGHLCLRCCVMLQATENCVRYQFCLETAPAGTEVFVNGWQVGVVWRGDSLAANVTDQVALGENVVQLRVVQAGALRGASLRAYPCE